MGRPKWPLAERDRTRFGAQNGPFWAHFWSRRAKRMAPILLGSARAKVAQNQGVALAMNLISRNRDLSRSYTFIGRPKSGPKRQALQAEWGSIWGRFWAPSADPTLASQIGPLLLGNPAARSTLRPPISGCVRTAGFGLPNSTFRNPQNFCF